MKCTVVLFFLVAALAEGQVIPDPMQQFWWPTGCADGPKSEMKLGPGPGGPGGPGCCMTLAPPDTAFGRPCVFPFKFDGVEYNACTYVNSEYLWCATDVADDGNMVPNRYGDCDIVEWWGVGRNSSCPFTKCEPGSTWKTGPPYKKTCICHDDGVAVCEPKKGGD